MTEKLRKGLRTWIEIDKKAIKNNYNQFRKLIPKDCKLCSVVKSNAYGHGIFDFSKEIVSLGVDFLAVDSVVEALALRGEKISTPILVLGYTLPEMILKAVQKNVSITISHFEGLNSLLKVFANKKIKIHIKVDSGMHRQGFFEEDIEKVIKFLKENKEIIEVEGLYTHFATAKNPDFPEGTKNQIISFKKWTKAFKENGFKTINHASATAGTIVYPEAHFDMVRIGIGMYGLWPSPEVKKAFVNKVDLKPALSWKTLVSEIKKIKAGERVGYDFTEEVKRPSVIAILPIGYWHGFPRVLSSIGQVLIRGKKVKVVGRVSMDMIVVDVTDVSDVSILDEAIIIGRSNKEEVTAEEIVDSFEGSYYEFITRINPLIKKFYI